MDTEINMVKHILRLRQTDKDIFEDIRGGRKIVETRAASPRFRNIKPGDTVIFICAKERFEKKVKKAQVFKCVSEMLREYEIKDIMPEAADKDELIRVYHGFPGYREKIEKFGLIALEFDKN